MFRLNDYIASRGRTPVVPLMSYPGIHLTRSSIKLNEFNWGVHAWTLDSLVERFAPDGIFLMMDLAVEASGMGLQVRFPLQESPSVEIHPVNIKQDLDQFKAVDILKDGRAYAFVETLRQLGAMLPADTLRGAFVTSPFTLAGLLMGAADVAMKVLLEPGLVQRVLQLATSVATRYALALEDAGAQVIMLLDPSALLLGPKHFDRFAGSYAGIVADSLRDAAPVYHVCGDTTALLDRFADLPVQGLSLDSDIDLSAAATRVPEDMVLMGNIDPVRTMLRGTSDEVRRAVTQLRKTMAGRESFILSSGCDLPADVPFANIEAFIETGKAPVC